MGSCCCVDATTREVDKKMASEEEIDQNTSKILFLGAGGAGKSTLFKQLSYIYNGAYSIKLDKRLKQKIYSQITEQMQIALKISINSHQEEQMKRTNLELHEHIQSIENHYDMTTFPPHVSDAIQYTWEHCKPLQTLMEQMSFRHKILEETSVYFWNELERIKQPDYAPNDLDFLNLREKTTGITQKYLMIQNKRFHIFDVGGQVSERKKWIHCFADVTALLFVVGLSSYNQTMYEDSSRNCMVDSMHVFEEVCNNEVFNATQIIVFLNKKDIFKHKLKKRPITDCPAFKDFLGYTSDERDAPHNDEYDYEQCCSYIKAKFNALPATPRRIYTQ
eukprot:115647_1